MTQTRSRYRYTREGALVRLDNFRTGWWVVSALTDEGDVFKYGADTAREAWRVYRLGLARLKAIAR